MLHQSMWLGPPLPPYFIEFLGGKNILGYLKFFEVKEVDIVSGM